MHDTHNQQVTPILSRHDRGLLCDLRRPRIDTALPRQVVVVLTDQYNDGKDKEPCKVDLVQLTERGVMLT